MTSSNYQINAVDLDSTYIPGNDPNYAGIQSAVTNRKTVIFGQQTISQTYPYPIGNLNGAINYVQSLPVSVVDQDSTTITGVAPTAVFYKSRSTGQSLIRASFNLLENYPQSGYWQINSYQLGISSPAQININGWTSVGSFYLGSNLGLQSNGTLWSWGNNNGQVTGQLGNNSTNTLVNPTQVGALSNWARISCGYAFAGIQSNGTLWIWGQNLYGQLGLSDTTSRSSPVQVGALSVWSQIFCGYGSTYAIQSNGTLWAWGQGGQGQLGNLSTTNISSPVQIGTVSIWAKVLGSAGSGQYTIGLQSNGTLWSWGAGNNYYSLGQGNLTSYSSPVQIGSTSTWRNIATGSFFSLALQSNGTLWSWGLNNAGQLGLNDQTTRSVPTQVGALSLWAQIACGYSHTLAIQSNGTLWACGQNYNGQLGLNTSLNYYTSLVQVGALSTWAQVASYSTYNSLGIQSNGTLWSWGNNSYSQLGLVPYGITVTKITYGL